MSSNEYLKLCQEAQNKKLKLARQQEQQIKQIYNDMYKDLSKKLKKVNPDFLTKRYLDELQIELEKEIKDINNKVNKIIKVNTNKSSKLANDIQLDFFMSINDRYNLDMKDTFAGMFYNLPKEVMNEILFGSVYKDRKGLNERIWKYTKKFEKDIDYILIEGVANKKSIYEIAKDLEVYVKPNARKPWEWSNVYPNASKTVDYNAQRLARTAINHAFQQAQKRSCQKNPFVTGIQWLSSNSHRTCELCNSRNGVIYKINDLPLDHPNGMCTTIPLLEKELDQIGEELRAWLDGESKSKLDKWYSNYGEEFSGVKVSKNKENSELSASKYKNSDIISNKKWLEAEFATKKKFDKHIEKHINEYGDISPQEYLDISRKLLSESLSEDVEGFASDLGFIFKYRKSTNDFAIGRDDGYISTLYKPKDGYNHWLEEKEKYKKKEE